MIHVIATIELVEGRLNAFLKEFHQIVPLVQAEEGCIEYGPTVDAETQISAQIPLRNNVVTVVEKWESLEALTAHLSAPHMTEYREKVKEMVKSTSLQVLKAA